MRILPCICRRISRADPLDEIQRARDVGVDHVLHFGEFLVEKSLAQAVTRIGEQRIDARAPGARVQLIDAFAGGEVRLDGIDFGAERTQHFAAASSSGSSAAINRS